MIKEKFYAHRQINHFFIIWNILDSRDDITIDEAQDILSLEKDCICVFTSFSIAEHTFILTKYKLFYFIDFDKRFEVPLVQELLEEAIGCIKDYGLDQSTVQILQKLHNLRKRD